MVKYDTPGYENETRRQFNERFGFLDNPMAEPPDNASHVWEWFWEISSQRKTNGEGAEPITASLVRDWSAMTGNSVTRQEYKFLMAMDAKYREAWALEADRFSALADKENQWTSQ